MLVHTQTHFINSANTLLAETGPMALCCAPLYIGGGCVCGWFSFPLSADNRLNGHAKRDRQADLWLGRGALVGFGFGLVKSELCEFRASKVPEYTPEELYEMALSTLRFKQKLVASLIEAGHLKPF